MTSPTLSPQNQTAQKKHIFRRLYHWVLHWADTPYGPIALFLLAMLESSIFPIPPDVLLIPLCLGNSKKSFRFAWICTLGSVLGGIIGYSIGFAFWELARDFFIPHIFPQESFNHVYALYKTWNFWIVFAAAFTPIPYKVITITAGVFGVPFIPFLIASIVGRAGRFYLVSALIYFFGPPIARLIDKYFNWLAIAFVVLLVFGFYLLKFGL